MFPRREITQRVLDLLDSGLDLDSAEKLWFRDLRSNGGFRLSDHGLKAFVEAKIESWSVPLAPKTLTKRLVLDMNRRIRWPYYIRFRGNELILFSSRDAVMARLYGDVLKWVDALTDRSVDQ